MRGLTREEVTAARKEHAEGIAVLTINDSENKPFRIEIINSSDQADIVWGLQGQSGYQLMLSKRVFEQLAMGCSAFTTDAPPERTRTKTGREIAEYADDVILAIEYRRGARHVVAERAYGSPDPFSMTVRDAARELERCDTKESFLDVLHALEQISARRELTRTEVSGLRAAHGYEVELPRSLFENSPEGVESSQRSESNRMVTCDSRRFALNVGSHDTTPRC